MRNRKRHIAVATAIVTLAGLLAYASLTLTTPEKLASSAAIGGEFALASSRGGIVSSESLRGRPYGVFFGFTHCPEVCPTTLYEMSQSLGALGEDAKDFRLFFITVDPERDTTDKLRDYLANFDPRIEALVPTLEQLPLIAGAFRAVYEKVPTSDGTYTMNHTATLFLFDRQGKFRSTISYGEQRAAREAKIRKLASAG
jgi:protein SCO1/2